MPDLTTVYPEFIPNQILTDGQLNQLREHLEQEDRQTRLRLAGMGIACGLHASTLAGAERGVRIQRGFGITSDGYLIDFCDGATFRHFRPYVDPDVEGRTIRYAPWQVPGDPTRQREIVELIPESAMALPADERPAGAIPFTDVHLAGSGAESRVAGRVLVLYLERDPEELHSCLVTSCDNKGRNVNVHVRALLVERTPPAAVPSPPAPQPLRLPRLHTRAEFPGDVSAAFAGIVAAQQAIVIARIQALFDTFRGFLNLPPVDTSTLAARLAAGPTQYRYDALLDLAAAHNEAAAAAFALVTECCPTGRFPRHLMLGVLDGTSPVPYRNEFTPSALRNVAHGEYTRVCDLFKRLDGMIFALDADPPPSVVTVRPSHTAAYPLGRRALPFYFSGSGMTLLWRPRARATMDADWPWLSPFVATSLGTDYAESTFLRIDGHIGRGWPDAVEDVVARRQAGNAEFQVVTSFVDGLAREEQELRAQFEEQRRLPEAGIAAARDELQRWFRDGNADIASLLALANGSSNQMVGLSAASERWLTARNRRPLHCDTSPLARDYAAARTELVYAVSRARGALARVRGDLTHVDDDALIGPGLERMLDGVQSVMVDHLVAAVVARPREWSRDVQIHTRLLAVTRLSGAPLLREALSEGLQNLAVAYERLLESVRSPKIEALDYELLADRFRSALGQALELWYWMRALGVPVPGLAVQPRSEQDVPLHPAERHQLAADWLALRANLLARFAAVAATYDLARAGDVSLFANLARLDGLEHLAGVSKGGTFVLVAENPRDGTDRGSSDAAAGTVIADFALERCPPCCCEIDPDALCTPPLALPDVRVVTMPPDGAFSRSFILDVTGNDGDPGVEESGLKIARVPERSALGARLLAKDSVIGYVMPEQVQPGTVDRFDYEIQTTGGRCGERAAAGRVVVIYAVAPAAGPGRLDILVVHDDSDERGDDAIVSIRELGLERMTSGSGELTLDSIPAGTYTLVATQDSLQSDPTHARVDAGAATSVVLRLKKTGSGSTRLLVRVVDASGAVIPGVAVDVRRDGVPPRQAMTNAAGEATIPDLPAGSYVISLQRAGFTPVTLPVTLTGGTQTHTVTLQR